MRNKLKGLGLVECMIATLIFVTGAMALMSLTLRCQWRTNDITMHNQTSARQQWVQARLMLIAYNDYMSLETFIQLISADYFGAKPHALTMQPEVTASTQKGIHFSPSALSGSHRVTIKLIVTVPAASPPTIVEATVTRPVHFSYPSSLPIHN